MPNEPLPVDARVCVEVASVAQLPSKFGDFRVFVFSNDQDDKEHLAMVHGDVQGAHDVVTRVHSECLTGDVLGSLRCDCRDQLERSLSHVGSLPRGIGLTNKIRAYGLQERGLDTVEANLALGFADDMRQYGVAAAMLDKLGVRSIQLMTNNPDKVQKLQREGVVVARASRSPSRPTRTTVATCPPRRAAPVTCSSSRCMTRADGLALRVTLAAAGANLALARSA